MASLERPLLRPLSGRQVVHQGLPCVALDDTLGLIGGQVLIPLDAFHRVVRHFDGRTTLPELSARAEREAGLTIPLAELEALVDRLDRAMVLDGPTFAAFAGQYASKEVRAASHAGRSYPADPAALRRDLARSFEDPKARAFPPRPAHPLPPRSAASSARTSTSAEGARSTPTPIGPWSNGPTPMSS